VLAPDRGEPARRPCEQPVGSSTVDRLVDAARRLAADVLAPAAEATDQGDVVPTSHLEALAAAGLMGVSCPEVRADAATRWDVFEALAGACGVTFFVWVQHHAPVRLLASSDNADLRSRWLPSLCSGAVLGGVAFAHLRRPGPPALAARRAGGGFVLDGEAPYVTSWGLAGMFAVAARLGDRVLFVAVPADAPGLKPSPPLRLVVMNASRTVRLGFDGLFVPDEGVMVDLPFADWQEQDRLATARPIPAPFGVAATCTRLLAEREPAAAAALDDERLGCRKLSLEADPDDLDRLVELRAWSLELSLRSAYALVTATGGQAMLRSHPAQRLVREASFYAIQAQTRALRAATLARLTR
jgi:alkylation response protein AidB-like acyl-CoA dehydrogenase